MVSWNVCSHKKLTDFSDLSDFLVTREGEECSEKELIFFNIYLILSLSLHNGWILIEFY